MQRLDSLLQLGLGGQRLGLVEGEQFSALALGLDGLQSGELLVQVADGGVVARRVELKRRLAAAVRLERGQALLQLLLRLALGGGVEAVRHLLQRLVALLGREEARVEHLLCLEDDPGHLGVEIVHGSEVVQRLLVVGQGLAVHELGADVGEPGARRAQVVGEALLLRPEAAVALHGALERRRLARHEQRLVRQRRRRCRRAQRRRAAHRRAGRLRRAREDVHEEEVAARVVLHLEGAAGGPVAGRRAVVSVV
mmetsp:Transcript_28153/g.100039  ORF Transcript_28153/g.100039 Transcript_28153/m.100039 type:complete len:253 (+) Transcript_28153:440-1198(+)